MKRGLDIDSYAILWRGSGGGGGGSGGSGTTFVRYASDRVATPLPTPLAGTIADIHNTSRTTHSLVNSLPHRVDNDRVFQYFQIIDVFTLKIYI